jgi:hypothetical protein
MKFSFKKLFTGKPFVNYLYILFLIGIIYLLFSKTNVLEGFGCHVITSKAPCNNSTLYKCRWTTKNKRNKDGEIIQSWQYCKDISSD